MNNGNNTNTAMTLPQLLQMLTFKEAMDYLRVSRSTLYRRMWDGELTGHKVGSTWRFYVQDLLKVVKQVDLCAPLN